jgi:hypothetical protein
MILLAFQESLLPSRLPALLTVRKNDIIRKVNLLKEN